MSTPPPLPPQHTKTMHWGTERTFWVNQSISAYMQELVQLAEQMESDVRYLQTQPEQRLVHSSCSGGRQTVLDLQAAAGLIHQAGAQPTPSPPISLLPAFAHQTQLQQQPHQNGLQQPQQSGLQQHQQYHPGGVAATKL